MKRTVKLPIGIENFEKIRTEGFYYVDKTGFIKEWWENRDRATLITRPRRFGKTLTMNMVDYFLFISMHAGEICLKDVPSGRRKSIRSCRGLIRLFF